MNKRVWYVTLFLVMGVAGYAIVQYFIMDAKQAGMVQMKIMYLSKLSAFWYTILYIHIASSIATLVIGPFALSTKFREKSFTRHRRLGKVYMIGILLGGISGLYLAVYATGGIVGKLGFGFLSIFWLLTAYQALVNVKNRKVHDHQKWMIRNYALTFAAVTLRIWLPIFALAFGLENFERSYSIIAWVAWVPNLLIAELYIQRKLNK